MRFEQFVIWLAAKYGTLTNLLSIRILLVLPKIILPSGQNLADSVWNPQGNLGCKCIENPRGNSGEIFKSGLK